MSGFLRYSFAVLVGASSVLARPNLFPRQAANESIIPITGASLGGVQPRLEIHDLQQNEDQWNIFLLGLQAFQAVDPSDAMSWYQICGIHGVPYVEYASVPQCDGCPTSGYCTHSSTLFPNWHRAYVGLFEQALQANALGVAYTFSGSDQQRYVQAATDLRLPYWDWALTPPEGESAFPQMFTDTEISVNTPTGQQTIANPLQSYSFGTADYSFMATPFTPDSDVTVRNPTFTYSVREQLKTDLYTTLTGNQGFNSFSTESLYTIRDNYNPYSIEMLHDRVHALVGGDMAYIPTAGFDPIFWLHHAAIDHAYALWQAVYPDDWMEPWAEVGSSFTYTRGTTEDSQSPLTPFQSNTDGAFWSPDAVRYTTALNYEYADLASGQSAAAIINSNYGGSTAAASSKRSSHHTARVETVPEYIADIRADSMSTKGTFSVFLFDGDFNEEHADLWHESDSILARHSFFTGPEKKGDGDNVSNAGASITAALHRAVADGKLRSLDEDDVTAYLRENLKTRVKMLHGQVVSPSDIPGFQVQIMTSDVRLPAASEELPVRSAYRALSL